MNQIEKQSALALIKSCLDHEIKRLKPGRVKGLMLKISKKAMKRIKKMPYPTDSENAIIYENIEKWTQLTGWENKELHPATICSFICAICDN